MAGNTKEKIAEVALALFAQSGYSGTSMRDIAEQLGITKGALYKHYTGKQEILDCIVERMRRSDGESAMAYEMPLTEPCGTGRDRPETPPDRIRTYSMAQFRYWTEEKFPSDFRKMLTLEQYREQRFADLYQDYLAAGPVRYMAAIFRGLADSDAAAMQLALDFYGPMFLLYSVYDGAEDKMGVAPLLGDHIDRFFARFL